MPIVSNSEAQAVMTIVHQLNGDGRPVWVKRGDVHAETSADVVAAKEAGVTDAIAGFARRGGTTLAPPAPRPRPRGKLYAPAHGPFFFPVAPHPRPRGHSPKSPQAPG